MLAIAMCPAAHPAQEDRYRRQTSSHIRPHFNGWTRSPVGIVEPQRCCEGGGSGDVSIGCTAAIAGKPAPTFDRISKDGFGHLWELSSPSEAAKAACQATSVLAVPPLSQASQLPHSTAFQRMDSVTCGSCRAPARLRRRWIRRRLYWLYRRYRRQTSSHIRPHFKGWTRSPVGVVEPQRGCEGGGSGDVSIGCAAAIAGKPAPTFDRISTDGLGHLWELSSPSEAAKAVGQATSLLAVPPLSQASQLPHSTAFQRMDSVTCGSCRAPARLRRRWVRWHLYWLCHRFRRQASSHRERGQGWNTKPSLKATASMSWAETFTHPSASGVPTVANHRPTI
ncbi:hypothetical protein ACVWVP_004096 [Pseudomonas sp. TE24901]